MFFMLISVNVHANFDTVLGIYEAKRFEQAREAFEALAAIGHRGALFNLGVMHYRGESVEEDLLKGYALMSLAIKDSGADDLAAVVEAIDASFTAQQRLDAAKLILQLTPLHDIDVIYSSIFPTLRDDTDSELGLLPLKKFAPRYPRKAQVAGRVGYSIAELTVSPRGYVRDLFITHSVHKSFSSASAVAALKFRYELPPDGKPVNGVETLFTYHLESRGKIEQIASKRIRAELQRGLAEAEAGDAIAQFKYARSLRELKGLRGMLEKVDIQDRAINKWLEKSAKGGVPHAQFELGKNMMAGRGCETDVVNGMKWIKAAAVGGHDVAQHFLARELLSNAQTDQANLATMNWLRNAAASGYYPATVLLAWELATSTTENLRDASEALALLEEDSDEYFDEVRILETKAAAHARLNNYKQAIKLQKKALSLADDLDWSIPHMQDRLDLYQHSRPWSGRYY